MLKKYFKGLYVKTMEDSYALAHEEIFAAFPQSTQRIMQQIDPYHRHQMVFTARKPGAV